MKMKSAVNTPPKETRQRMTAIVDSGSRVRAGRGNQRVTASTEEGRETVAADTRGGRKSRFDAFEFVSSSVSPARPTLTDKDE